MAAREQEDARDLWNLALQGAGYVAIATEGAPLVLGVGPEVPPYTDGHATVAWSQGLNIGFKTDVSWKTFIGKGSGESVQMAFSGTGFVVVQPFEEGSEAPGTGGGSGGSSGGLGGLGSLLGG